MKEPTFEENIQRTVEKILKEECFKISEKHINNAISEMREKASELIVKSALIVNSQINVYSHSRELTIALKIPENTTLTGG